MNPLPLLPLKLRLVTDLLPFSGFYDNKTALIAELYIYCYRLKGIGLEKISHTHLQKSLGELLL